MKDSAGGLDARKNSLMADLLPEISIYNYYTVDSVRLEPPNVYRIWF